MPFSIQPENTFPSKVFNLADTSPTVLSSSLEAASSTLSEFSRSPKLVPVSESFSAASSDPVSESFFSGSSFESVSDIPPSGFSTSPLSSWFSSSLSETSVESKISPSESDEFLLSMLSESVVSSAPSTVSCFWNSSSSDFFVSAAEPSTRSGAFVSSSSTSFSILNIFVKNEMAFERIPSFFSSSSAGTSRSSPISSAYSDSVILWTAPCSTLLVKESVSGAASSLIWIWLLYSFAKYEFAPFSEESVVITSIGRSSLCRSWRIYPFRAVSSW